MNTLVKDVLTINVCWVDQGTPFATIASAFREYRVSAFPVLDQAGQSADVDCRPGHLYVGAPWKEDCDERYVYWRGHARDCGRR